MRRAIPRRRAARPMDPPIRPTPTMVSVSNTTPLSRLQHSSLPRIREKPARLNDRGQLAKRLERPDITRCVILQPFGRCIELEVVARANLFAEPVGALQGHNVAAIHRVAEEDASEELGDHRLNAGGFERNWCVLARRAAA